MYTLQKGRTRKTEIKSNRATPMEQKLRTAALPLQPGPQPAPTYSQWRAEHQGKRVGWGRRGWGQGLGGPW